MDQLMENPLKSISSNGLSPSLKLGQIVIMDRFLAFIRGKVRELIMLFTKQLPATLPSDLTLEEGEQGAC